MKAEIIRETIKKSNPRSAWNKGVKLYALDLLEDLDDIDTTSRATIDAALLNGAESWQAYSYGGCALIYDSDIAERLCTHSELKRTRGGELSRPRCPTCARCTSAAQKATPCCCLSESNRPEPSPEALYPGRK